jgi:hypothetical protein
VDTQASTGMVNHSGIQVSDTSVPSLDDLAMDPGPSSSPLMCKSLSSGHPQVSDTATTANLNPSPVLHDQPQSLVDHLPLEPTSLQHSAHNYRMTSKM